MFANLGDIVPRQLKSLASAINVVSCNPSTTCSDVIEGGYFLSLKVDGTSKGTTRLLPTSEPKGCQKVRKFNHIYGLLINIFRYKMKTNKQFRSSSRHGLMKFYLGLYHDNFDINSDQWHFIHSLFFPDLVFSCWSL